jgi:hypothetical protein
MQCPRRLIDSASTSLLITSSHIDLGINQIPPYRYSGFGINKAEGTRTGFDSSFGDFLHGMFRVFEMIAQRQAFRAHFIHSFIPLNNAEIAESKDMPLSI